jgi:hypothetical protein
MEIPAPWPPAMVIPAGRPEVRPCEEDCKMSGKKNYSMKLIGICILLVVGTATVFVYAQQGTVISSYGPTNQDVSFNQIKAARMAVKAARAKEHMEMLNSRYLLAKKTSAEVFMSGGKPIPVGPTANLRGVTWEQLNRMSPEQIKEQGGFPYKP